MGGGGELQGVMTSWGGGGGLGVMALWGRGGGRWLGVMALLLGDFFLSLSCILLYLILHMYIC